MLFLEAISIFVMISLGIGLKCEIDSKMKHTVVPACVGTFKKNESKLLLPFTTKDGGKKKYNLSE